MIYTVLQKSREFWISLAVFGQTQQNIFLDMMMHIPSTKAVSKFCQEVLEHTNIMTLATPMHSSWQIFKEFNTPFQDLVSDNQAFTHTDVVNDNQALVHTKPCFSTFFIFILHSCVMGQ